MTNVKSHPTWVRGLKQERKELTNILMTVAPYMGAWIETDIELNKHVGEKGRTLHGCVD